jgi:FkbM family methyltransferase
MKPVGTEVALPGELTDRLAGSPIRLVDVGARGGIEPPWTKIASQLEVVGFEPSVKEFESLRRTAPGNVTYLNVALGDRSGQTTLYLTRSAPVASIFRPNASFLEAFEKDQSFEVVDTTECPVETLDRALSDAAIDCVDFLKIDTQGSELPILRGAPRTLGQFVFGVEVEIELNLVYEGQPLFGDVDAFLRPHGYELFDVQPQWRLRYSGRGLQGRGRGQSVWGDALYLKRPAAVAEHLAGIAAAERETEVAKLVTICLLYGIGDYALDVIASAGLPEHAARQLTDAVRRYDEQWASRLGIEYTFVLPPEPAGQLHKLARGRGERERRRPPEWFVIRAVRRWLAEHAPPSGAARIREAARRLRRTSPGS